MATTSSDPREIEADLERERAALASTLDTLSDRVSVDNLAKEALGMLRSHAGSATTTIDHAVRANPLAVALIGAGVAWMFLGGRVTGGSDRSKEYASGYAPTAAAPAASFGAPVTAPSTAYGRVGYVPSDNDDHAWSHEAHGLRARASDALRRIEEEAGSYYDSLRRGLASSASGARDFAAERATVVTGFASDLKARFASGLDALPEEARERVIAARERAYHAMLQAERMGREAWREPGRMLEEHPFVAGAITFALGAAAAAAIPSTDYENRTFGGERDRLMDDAARLLHQERRRAVEVAGSLGQEIKAAARETVEAVSDTVASKAEAAANRVSDRATEELGARPATSGSIVG